MGCCAVGTCTNPDCYICRIMPERFRVVPCRKAAADGEPCRFVKDHPGPCKSKAQGRSKTENVSRDGDPKLAGERPRQHPAFVKRRRAGPHWIPHDRRV